MPIITPERAGEIRGELCEKHGATWLHHYHEAIEREVSEYYYQVLTRIASMAHDASTGPAVPDTYGEICNIAQDAL